jgi:hypothetical protein
VVGLEGVAKLFAIGDERFQDLPEGSLQKLLPLALL